MSKVYRYTHTARSKPKMTSGVTRSHFPILGVWGGGGGPGSCSGAGNLGRALGYSVRAAPTGADRKRRKCGWFGGGFHARQEGQDDGSRQANYLK